MTFAARVVSLLALALLAPACGGSSGGEGSGRPSASSTASSSPSPTVQVLELGKSDLALEAGTVASPAGFEPALAFQVPDGWSSVHRYADSFDVGVPDPASDGPLVVVTFSLAPEPDARAALAAVADRQPKAKVGPGGGRLLGADVDRLDLVGGDGPAYTSRDSTLALDAAPGRTLHFLATDSAGAGSALVVGVLVSEKAGPAEQRLADAIVGSVRLADPA
jgi:hypothetical protein